MDKEDPKYLLCFSLYKKRKLFASKTFANDFELRESMYNTLVFKKDVHLENEEEDLQTYLEELVNDLAGVTQEEIEAKPPMDEIL